MSDIQEWEQKIKKAEEQFAKTQRMRQNLQDSSDERNLKVEQEVSAFGDETLYKLTDNAGARTEIHIKDNGRIEVRGEQTELAEDVEKGKKVQPKTAQPETQSEIKQQAYQCIDTAILSAEEKAELKLKINRYNFAEAKEKPEDMIDNLKTSVEQKENLSQPEENKQKEQISETLLPQTLAGKIHQLRGIDNNISPISVWSENMCVMSNTMTAAIKNVARQR